MNILIATPNHSEQRRLSRVLAALGHNASIAATPEEAIERVQSQRPDVALVGALTDPWLQATTASGGPHIYRVAMVGRLDGDTASKVWNAGFDDVTTKGACPAEIAGRVEAIERIRGWLHSMGDDFAAGGEEDILASPLIVELGEALSDEFGAMIGGSLTASRAPRLGDLAYVAEIPLNLVANAQELTLGIGVSAATSDTLGTLLFGEPVDRDVMADALREFANTAGGLVKRNGGDYGMEFSLGLPSDAVFPSPPSDAPIWRVAGEGIELSVWVVTADDCPKRVTASMLSEGMVLTQPILNEAGVMLVQAGAVLTQRTVGRLVELLGPSALVEVARAA